MLEKKSGGAKISVKDEGYVTIVGTTKGQVDAAAVLVKRILNPPTATVTCRDKAAIGRLIGPGGSTVRKIERDYGNGVRVKIDGSQVVISAESIETVRRVVDAVNRIVHPPTKILRVTDDKYISRVIGSGGKTIRGIEERSGARIRVDKGKHLITVQAASEHQVEIAVKMIVAVIQAPAVKISCPKEILGQIIGDGGCNVRMIHEQTGAFVEVLDSGTPGPATIKLTGDNLEKAKTMLLDEIQSALREPDYTGKEGSRLRKLASECAAKREHFYASAHRAFEDGDRDEGMRLIECGKVEAQKMRDYNMKASDAIFHFRNKGHGPLYLDLHGQYVADALDILRKRLGSLLWNNKDDLLRCITGAGHHSKNHVARIKPAVRKMVEDMGLKYEVDNAGAYIIHA
eukprot:g3325.t1